MSELIQQAGATNNQSFATIEKKNVFLFDNTYDKADFDNSSGGEITVKLGSLVARIIAGEEVTPATAINLADVIGIVTTDNDIVVPDTVTKRLNYAVSGDINENLLVFPATVTLATAVGNITLRDHLQGLGFHFQVGIENTNFDNL